MFPLEEPKRPICSAKGCRADARWVLAWNNPKLHTPERRKTWLACDEHRESLGQFLAVRGFLKDTVAFDVWTAGQQPSDAAGGESEEPEESEGQT
ncbi:MAG TPA: hypothetical protein VLH10_15780 [Yinghuangia sp.]|uniref:hypothetical protein n=1 Tax=Yinghuangia sp. YIM S10712 TaxID=3436930 RepID=UPI002B8118E3|nr:hypothetical protein [Yinghuangia sp.]